MILSFLKKTKIELLDILECKCINNKLQTTLSKKPTDQPSSLQVNFKHPNFKISNTTRRWCSLQPSITYFQFEIHIKTLKDQFIKHGYKKGQLKTSSREVKS